jgi:hypothetical protein
MSKIYKPYSVSEIPLNFFNFSEIQLKEMIEVATNAALKYAREKGMEAFSEKSNGSEYIRSSIEKALTDSWNFIRLKSFLKSDDVKSCKKKIESNKFLNNE